MFTGIIETLGIIKDITASKANLEITVCCAITHELKIDQSVAHNGICLTVISIEGNCYKVIAVQETIQKTTILSWKINDKVNIERAMKLGNRLDGHLVQGHIDQTALCTAIIDNNGSWVYTFEYNPSFGNITIEKGSITVNGVSLTVVNSNENCFEVAIIPYTFEHTTFKYLKVNDAVNLEFDVIGKYVSQLYRLKNK